MVVGRGLPGEQGGAVRAATLQAGGDEGIRGAAAAAAGRDEEVVHDADARGARRRPRPEDRREADRAPALVAGDQLHSLAHRVRDQGAAHDEEVLVARGDLVEVAVPAHQREQLGEVGLGDNLDGGHARDAISPRHPRG